MPPATRAKLLSLPLLVQQSMLKGKASLDLGDLEGMAGATRPTAPGLGLGPAPARTSTPPPPTTRPTSPARSVSPSKFFSRGSLSPSKMRLPSPSKLAGRRSVSPSKMGKLRLGRAADVAVPVASEPPKPGVRGSQPSKIAHSAMASWSKKTVAPSKTPVYFADLLKSCPAQKLDNGEMKRLRIALAAESPVWVETFGTQQGGYQALLNRLNELLDLEWREEQHDDQLLYELLRSLVILSTSTRGKSLLSSQAPKPFVALNDLLWSEKKPGDLYVRKLLLDMTIIAGELDMPASLLDEVKQTRQRSDCLARCDELTTMGALKGGQLLVLVLMHSPRDPDQEAIVDFVRVAHTPRPFKTLVYDMARVVADYFWVFCHTRNMIWRLEDMDPRAVDAAAQPKVPGGMTGGVEFEAMAYLTAHMKLINWAVQTLTRAEVASGDGSWAAPQALIKGLLDCGLDRILHSVRQASQTYYQPMHLELSIFYHQAAQAHCTLPHELAAWVGGAPDPPIMSRRKYSPLHPGATPIADKFTQEKAL